MPVVKTLGPAKNVAISSVLSGAIKITWDPPDDIPDDTEVYYSFRITRNGSFSVIYQPLGAIGTPPSLLVQPLSVFGGGSSGDVIDIEVLAYPYSVSAAATATIP